MNYPQALADWILDLIFPVRCINCNKIGPSYICSKCLNSISVKNGFECIGCKRNTPLARTCYFCRKNNHIDQLFIVADFKDKLVERSLKIMKYNFVEDISIPLSLLAKKYLKMLANKKHLDIFEPQPIFIPMPLHRERFNWRGFNQSEILAKKILSDSPVIINEDVLFRIRKAKPQADIEEKDERLKNVAGLFKCQNGFKISGREVILVDDVCTTGATLNECAKVLKQNGAVKVSALVIARG